MRKKERSDKLRELGLTPTIQRLAVLQSLENTRQHPTADQVLITVRKKFPSVSRATIYNTLEALTKAGIIQQITVDPAVARYDADLKPHAHFRCRICNTVYDIMMDKDVDLDEYVEGHHVEAVRTYAYGVCEKCLQKKDIKASVGKPNSIELTKRQKTSSSSNSLANTAPRKSVAFSDEPTKNIKKKVSQTSSLSDSLANTAPRKSVAFSDEPTKEVRDARAS